MHQKCTEYLSNTYSHTTILSCSTSIDFVIGIDHIDGCARVPPPAKLPSFPIRICRYHKTLLVLVCAPLSLPFRSVSEFGEKRCCIYLWAGPRCVVAALTTTLVVIDTADHNHRSSFDLRRMWPHLEILPTSSLMSRISPSSLHSS